MTRCRATAAMLSILVFDAGNISPHLAPLFPARRPQASAPERATPWTFGNSCEPAGAFAKAGSEVHHEALVDGG